MPMQPLIAQVKNGRLVLDEPTDLPEGQVIQLVSIDDEYDDQLDDAELQRELELSVADAEAGLVIDGDEFMAELEREHAEFERLQSSKT